MNEEKESERFRRLANENLELVYKAIETSEEPWWGFGILANREFYEVMDEQRTKELIELRADHILEALRTSYSPWDITWSMHRYLWFFERTDTLEALSEAIRNTDYSWQLFDDFKHHRILMRNQKLRSSFTYALEHSQNPNFVISVLRDYPDFLREETTMNAIIQAINTSDNIFPLIAEVTLIRILAENDRIQEAIQNRIPDLLNQIQPTAFNWMQLRDIAHVTSIVADERLAKRISSVVKEQNQTLLKIHAIWSLCNIPELTGNEIIQQTIAQVIEETEESKICEVLRPVAVSRLLVESESITSAISKKIDSLVSNILNAEAPRKAIQDIGMLPIVTSDERVKDAIRKRLPDIIQDVRNDTSREFITTFFESSIRIPEIYHNSEVRESIGTNVIMNDSYGSYQKKIAQFPSLAKDSLIRKFILRAINEFPDPAWFISSLAEIPGMYDDLEIQNAIEERIPRIIELIEADDETESLSEEIAENSFLMSFKEIEDAISNKVRSTPTPWMLIAGLPEEYLQKDFVSNIIRSGSKGLSECLLDDYNNTLDWKMIRIFRSEVASQLKNVQEVLDKDIANTLEDLESVWDVWYSISYIQDIPQYANDEKVLKTIRNRLSDLAHALKTNNDWVQSLHAISPYKDLLTDERILAGVAQRITTSHEPYSILDVDCLDSLLQEESIRDALNYKIPDFVFGITSTDQASFIVTEIDKIEFLRDDPRISKAIKEYRESTG